MKVGISLFVQNCSDWDRFEAREARTSDSEAMPVTDAQVFEEDLVIGSLAEPLGFDSLWTVEHHFTPYTMVPDPLQMLSYFAGRTERIEMGTMVVVLPWHDPLRVAEGIAMLDNMLRGRALHVGFGRGLGRREFGALRVPMDKSRELFVENFDIVRTALANEWFEYDGQFHQIPRTTIRPRPRSAPSTLLDHLYGSWGSPSSIPVVAETGLKALFIPQIEWSMLADQMQQYNAIRATRQLPAMRPTAAFWMYCAPTEEAAYEGARRYLPAYFDSAQRHYELASDHFGSIKGYENYAQRSSAMRDGSYNPGEMYLRTQIWGTPEQCYEKLMTVCGITGADHLIAVPKYGGMPLAEAEASMRLFAREVLPALQRVEVAAG